MHFSYLIKQQSLFSVIIIISSAMDKREQFLNRNHILFLKTGVQYIRHLQRNFVRLLSILKLTTARIQRLQYFNKLQTISGPAHVFRFLLYIFIMGFNQRELRLIRARPYSSLLIVTHMSHSSSQTAVSSVDCRSRDLNAQYKYTCTKTSIYISKRRKKFKQCSLWI